ncbi:BQ2448_5158 [Microbotryum intermedium]|uniref:BQ2448_5158 protein n=1 Tax=Microbotryum intermedium TaxID=269621 RepID=A0A238F3B6_9BASI|nr:BQ2448_5158 [Microbotryum intermedium]
MHVVSALAGWSDLLLERLALNVPAPSTTNHGNAGVSSNAPTEQPLEFNYQVFERIGREEWSMIAQRHQAIALQVNALQQCPTHARPAVLLAPQVATGTTGAAPTAGRPCPVPQLTAEERAYLDQNSGCYRCRAINADHISHNCP